MSHHHKGRSLESPTHTRPSSPSGDLYWLSMKALNLSVSSKAQSLPFKKNLLEKYEGYAFCEKDQ